MAYIVDGTGPIPVLAIHGLHGSKEQWILSKPAGVTLIAVDRLGFGDSSDVPASYDYAEVVADLTELLDALSVGNLALVGHGLGGGIALALAASLGARVKAVGLLSGNTDFTHRSCRTKEQCKVLPELNYHTAKQDMERISQGVVASNKVRLGWRAGAGYDWAAQFDRCCNDGSTEEWVEAMQEDSFFVCAITDASAKVNSVKALESDMQRHFFGTFPGDIAALDTTLGCNLILRCSAADKVITPAFSEQTKKVVPNAYIDVLPATGNRLDGGGMGHFSMLLNFPSLLLAIENVCETEFQEELERWNQDRSQSPVRIPEPEPEPEETP